VTRERMYLETMERVLGGASKIIIDTKSGAGVVPYLPLSELGKMPAPSAPAHAASPSQPQATGGGQ
jgi:membrane protease subunit HflK